VWINHSEHCPGGARIELREALLRALWPFVEARMAVAAALAELEAAAHNQISGARLEGGSNDRRLV
jgi:hypothetical protein